MEDVKTDYQLTDAVILDQMTCRILVEAPEYLRKRLKKLYQRECVAFLRYLNTYGRDHNVHKVEAARGAANERIRNLMRANFQRATRGMRRG